MWGFLAPKIITQIGGCGAKISHGNDPGALIPAQSYRETKEKVGFQERSFGPRYKLLVGGGVPKLSNHQFLPKPPSKESHQEKKVMFLWTFSVPLFRGVEFFWCLGTFILCLEVCVNSNTSSKCDIQSLPCTFHLYTKNAWQKKGPGNQVPQFPHIPHPWPARPFLRFLFKIIAAAS